MMKAYSPDNQGDEKLKILLLNFLKTKKGKIFPKTLILPRIHENDPRTTNGDSQENNCLQHPVLFVFSTDCLQLLSEFYP